MPPKRRGGPPATTSSAPSGAIEKKKPGPPDEPEQPKVEPSSAASAVNSKPPVQEPSQASKDTPESPPTATKKTRAQKRNKRKKNKDDRPKTVEDKAADRALGEMPSDPDHPARMEVLSRFQERVKAFPHLDSPNDTPAEILAKSMEQSKEFAFVEAEMDQAIADELAKVARPDQRNISSRQMLDQLRCARAAEDTEDSVIAWFEGQLKRSVAFEGCKKFQAELTELKKELNARRAENKLLSETAKRIQARSRLLDRIRILKRFRDATTPAEIQVPADAEMLTVAYDAPLEAMTAFAQPVNLSRKIERHFCVAIERSYEKNRARSFNVSGFPADVQAAIVFLRTTDFTGKVTTTLDDPKRFIGRQGVGIKKVEETHNVFLNIDGNVVRIYGPHDAALKALAATKSAASEAENTARESVVEVDFSPEVARAVVEHMAPRLRELEGKHNVSTRAMAATENSPARVVLRGKAEALPAARDWLKNFLTEVKTQELPATQIALRRLGIGSRSTQSEFRLADSPYRAVIEDFALLRDASNLTFFRPADRESLVVVGEDEELERLRKRIETLVQKACHSTTRIPIMREQVACFGEDNLSWVMTESDTQVTIRKGKETALEVLGDDSQKLKAEAVIEGILAREGHIDTLELEEDETVRQLVKSMGQRLEELEQSCGVSLSLDKATRKIRAMGPSDGVADAFRFLRDLEGQIKMRESKAIPIDPAHIRLIIGPSGQTIRQIRAVPGIARVSVDDENCRIEITGLPESISVADRMIRDIIGAQGPQQDSAAPAHQARPRGPKPQKEASEVLPRPDDMSTFPDLSAAKNPPTKNSRRRRNYRKTSHDATSAAMTPSATPSEKEASPSGQTESPTPGGLSAGEGGESPPAAEVVPPTAAAAVADAFLEGPVEQAGLSPCGLPAAAPPSVVGGP